MFQPKGLRHGRIGDVALERVHSLGQRGVSPDSRLEAQVGQLEHVRQRGIA
jgi:hypothetical protein